MFIMYFDFVYIHLHYDNSLVPVTFIYFNLIFCMRDKTQYVAFWVLIALLNTHFLQITWFFSSRVNKSPLLTYATLPLSADVHLDWVYKLCSPPFLGAILIDMNLDSHTVIRNGTEHLCRIHLSSFLNNDIFVKLHRRSQPGY